MTLLTKGLFGALLVVSSASAASPIKVVTTTTDLADIAGRIGGDHVNVQALASGAQNPHHVEAKPSLIVKLMDADLFIQTGFELESGWAPLLIESSRNRRILPGATGFLEAADAVEPLEVPDNPTRAMGDVHPHGNPHFMADPENGARVAKAIAERLSRIAPERRSAFEANLATFLRDLAARIKEWDALMAPHRGRRFVSYHRDWTYFAHRYGLVSAGEIEPKPGIPPTASHTAELIDRMKKENVAIIITDPWYEDRTAAFISRATGARTLRLALFPGGVPGTGTYIETVDHNVRSVAAALSAQP